MPRARQRRAYIALLLIVALWGSFAPTSKIALAYAPPGLIAVVRMFLASGFLVQMLVRRDHDDIRALGWHDLPPFLLLGLLGFVLSTALTYVAISLTTASNAVILQTAAPVMITLGARAFLGERLRARQWAGVVVSALGVLLVVTRGRVIAAQLADLSAGDFVQLLGIASWSAYTLYGKRVLARHSPALATTAAYVCGTVLLVPLVVVTTPSVPATASSWLPWIIVVYHAIPGAIAHVYWYRAVEVVGPSRAAIFMNLQPIVGIALAAVLTGEAISVWQLVGGALVLGGVVLTTTPPRRR